MVIGITSLFLTAGVAIEAKKYDNNTINVRFHDEILTKKEAGKKFSQEPIQQDEEGGMATVFLTTEDIEKLAEKRAQELEKAEEAKELDESLSEETGEKNRELDSENVRETDSDDGSSGHGNGGTENRETEAQAAEEGAEKGAEGDESPSDDSERTEVPPETKEDVSEERKEEGGTTDENGAQGAELGTFEMTAYVAYCDTGCTGITATGYDVRNTIYSPEGLRIVAADPGVLPLGTTVEIDSGGNTIQAVVMDTGGAINGNRLDLLVESEVEAREYGRQSVEVRVISY